MQLIISPELSNQDIEAIKNAENYISYGEDKIKKQLIDFLTGDEVLKTSSQLFFQLIISEVLEVKIAIPKNNYGLFHEKIGLFYSLLGDEKIAISGSNNETYRSVGVNHESFNTFCSWKIGQNEYVSEHEEDFEKYWNNDDSNLNVFGLDKALVKDVFKKIGNSNTIDDNFEYLKLKEKEVEYYPRSSNLSLDFIPYDYQEAAAHKLIENQGGILEFATGSGKTKTAIYYMELLKQKYSKNFFIIVVPDKTLLVQWYKELETYNPNIVSCYSGNDNWLKEFRNMVDIYNTPLPSNQVAIVTNQTMFRKGPESRFLKQFNLLKGESILIVDEVHNWSTEMTTDHLPLAKEKVALSATPFNDPKSLFDIKLESYFKGIVANYSLKEAIRDKKLVPYNYIPIFVQFTDEEKQNYNKITASIARLQKEYEKEKDPKYLEMKKYQSFSRARIVYGAANKLVELEELLKESYFEEDHLLIYCGATSYQDSGDGSVNMENEQETSTQVQKVNEILAKLNLPAAQYTQSENNQDREHAINLFRKKTLSTLVAIKCLDEGVDIPEIKNAIILASSSNKREFIQRRGRVLRKAKNKNSANIYDFIVRDYENSSSHLNNVERRRFKEFAELSMNYEELKNKYAEYMEGDYIEELIN